MKEKIKNIFTRKSVDVLIGIEDGYYLNKLSRKVPTAYAYVNHICHRFEEEGILTLELRGRNSIIKLTKKGRILQKHFKEMMGDLTC